MAVRHFGLNSEYGRLSSVLLYRPEREIGNYVDLTAIQHLAPIDHEALMREFDHVIQTFENCDIEVIQIDATPLSDNRLYRYNMMYCRDLLFMTPEGAVLAHMANSTRKEEVLYAEHTLKAHGIPVIHAVSGMAGFEGADALWVNDRLVVVGMGNRTNKEGHDQIKDVLKSMGIDCAALPFRQTGPQHLLGVVQLVDKDMALVRYEIVDREIIRFLEDHHFSIVKIPENNEVRTRQAMNIVTLSPRSIIMTAECPETRDIYVQAGLTIAAELELVQLLNGAGGLACATGVISRW